MLSLWEDLHEIRGSKSLLTNRLYQECVENLFSVIRGEGGQRHNPDPAHFGIASRQVMVDAVPIPSTSANCREDLDTFLFTLTGGKTATEQTLVADTASSHVDADEKHS